MNIIRDARLVWEPSKCHLDCDGDLWVFESLAYTFSSSSGQATYPSYTPISLSSFEVYVETENLIQRPYASLQCLYSHYIQHKHHLTLSTAKTCIYVFSS